MLLVNKVRAVLRHAVIRCAWDDEAGVWFVRDADIPGLVTEAPTLEALRRKLPGMVQDLVDVATDIASIALRVSVSVRRPLDLYRGPAGSLIDDPDNTATF